MGLDLVELVMAVEDEFGVSMPDDEAQRIETVGQLHAWVIAATDRRRPTSCPAIVAFGRFRQAMVDSGVAMRGDVRLDTELSAWFGASPEAWAFVMRSLGMRLTAPPLPPRTRSALRIASTLCFLIALAAGYAILKGIVAPMLVVPAVALLSLSIVLAARLENRPPVECGTVRGFVNRYKAVLAPAPVDDAWNRIVRLVSEVSGIEPSAIRPQTHFIGDLGLD